MKFTDKLAKLGFATYNAYLKGDHWLEFRKQYENSGMTTLCGVCKAACVELHHLTYDRLGDELFTDVIPLCRAHHSEVHKWLAKHSLSIKHTKLAVNHLKVKLEGKNNQKHGKETLGASRRRQKKQKAALIRAHEKASKFAKWRSMVNDMKPTTYGFPR